MKCKSLAILLTGLCALAACQPAQVGQKMDAQTAAAAAKHDFGFTAAFQDEIQ